MRDLHHKKAATLQHLFEEAPDEGDAVLRHIDRHTAAARGAGRGRSRSRPQPAGREADESAAHRYPLRGSRREICRSTGPQTRQTRGSGAGSDEKAGEAVEDSSGVDGGLPPSGTVVYSSTDTGHRSGGGARGSVRPTERPEYASIELLSVSRASDRTHKYTARFRVDSQDKAIHFGAVGYQDFTQHHDDARRANYIRRHSAREDFGNPLTAGALSRRVLWEKPTLAEGVAEFKARFGL